MVQAINEVKTDGNFGIGIVADDAGATYFGTDQRIVTVTNKYNVALLATRVFRRKFDKAGGLYPAFLNDLQKLLSEYSSCMLLINELDNLPPEENSYLHEIYYGLEKLEGLAFILLQHVAQQSRK